MVDRRHAVKFVRLPVDGAFLYEGRFYRKIDPIPVDFPHSQRVHNCRDENGRSTFMLAMIPVWPVTFAEVRAAGSGKLLFRYAAEFGLVEIKPKGEERPLLVKLGGNDDWCTEGCN